MSQGRTHPNRVGPRRSDKKPGSHRGAHSARGRRVGGEYNTIVLRYGGWAPSPRRSIGVSKVTARHRNAVMQTSLPLAGIRQRRRGRNHIAAWLLRCGFLWLACQVALGGGMLSAEQITLTEMRRITRQSLILEADAESVADKLGAAFELCDLYAIMRTDSRYDDSAMLRGDALKIRRRLLGIARREEIKLDRDGSKRPGGLDERVDRAVRVAVQRSSLQRSSPVAAGMEGDAFAVADQGGGANQVAWQLVELIERVTDPDFWETRGGTGSIRYFAMRRVLVVRATSDIHQQIKDLLTTLR